MVCVSYIISVTIFAESKLIIILYRYSILVEEPCNETLDCKGDNRLRFCNFDYGDTGICVGCTDVEDSCEYALVYDHFMTEPGVKECEAICEG